MCSSDLWSACTSPLALTGLAEGSHTVAVRLADLAGNTGSSVSATWVVDTTPPATAPTLGGVPSGVTNVTTVSATLTGAIVGETYECRFDGGTWAACTSPYSPSGLLADGGHVVAARKRDAAGNTGPVASQVWTIDTAPPAAPANGAYQAATSSTSSTFTFAGEPDSTFSCRIRRTAPTSATLLDWSSCTSPYTTPTYAAGSYALDIRQTDVAGNVSTTQTITWTIDTSTPPDVVFGAIPTSPTKLTTAAPTLTYSADTLSADTPPVATTYALFCKVDGGAWGTAGSSDCPVTGAGTTRTLTLTGLTEGAHTVSAYQTKTIGTDPATVGATTSIVWTVDTTPPAAPGVTGQPANPTSSASATFDATAEAGTTLECKLDKIGRAHV